MNSDNPFEQSRKRQADIIARQRLQAQLEQDERQHQRQVAETNALAVHQRLESILRHLTPKISDAKAQDYDITHQFRLGNILPSGSAQCYYRLGLYMKRGGVIQSLDPYRLPEADYALEFTGQPENGAIEVKYFAKPTGVSATLKSFASVGELSNAELDSVWKIFVDKSLATDEERMHRS